MQRCRYVGCLPGTAGVCAGCGSVSGCSGAVGASEGGAGTAAAGLAEASAGEPAADGGDPEVDHPTGGGLDPGELTGLSGEAPDAGEGEPGLGDAGLLLL
jgi:hypothetical protein